MVMFMGYVCWFQGRKNIYNSRFPNFKNKNPKSFVSEHGWFNPLTSLLLFGVETHHGGQLNQWHPKFSQDSRTVWKVLQPVRLNKSGEGNGWVFPT